MSEYRDFQKIVKRFVEIEMPDLRHYYRIQRKAKIMRTYPCEGQYYADVQVLLNSGTEDTDFPLISKVEIPTFWGGEQRGIVCPPQVGAECDLVFSDGDPNFMVISAIRNANNTAPHAEENEFIIQQEEGVYIKIDKEHQLIFVTPSNYKVEVKGDAEIKAEGNVKLQANKNCEIEAMGDINLISQQNINIRANGTVRINASAVLIQE